MESNKLIAEFMGVPCDKDLYTPLCPHTGETLFIPSSQMKYDTSWDWLMPVLKKITIGKLNPSNYRKWRMINTPTEYTIEEVYKAVVRFIKKYNDGKQ